ncbi:hypothetical protein TM5383_02333 [Thalassovita mediterranea]|uniref:Uncharacterized protein n=1 Tax=Thalassovita mediterranea TaxID=340021 RepID=A0A0P1GRB2_9RHOB|nr:hypothetical protein TM5383_02333 [Thalassovita mediterranea]SIS35245.1 hypothetical protein SAMN05421685_11469 [Thalassovita mediterranea]
MKGFSVAVVIGRLPGHPYKKVHDWWPPPGAFAA